MYGKWLTSLALLLLPLVAGAQFYSTGVENPGIGWNETASANFRIIYPRGLDSLALEYGKALEKNRPRVGATAGILPNQMYRKPMPVILHAYTSDANGSVAWAPRRMDLFTTMDPYSAEPTPWITELAIHESRHVAQMQYGRYGHFGWWHYLIGEAFAGAACAVWGGPWLLEGDAVVAETALTAMGRGRNADFLEYYRVCLSEGDWRDWNRWRWGSQKLYTPNHYALGYVTVAGYRTVFGDPLFTSNFYRHSFNNGWPYPLFSFRRTSLMDSGLPPKKAFRVIEESLARHWADDDGARGPFMPSEPVTGPTRLYSDIHGTSTDGRGGFWAIRNGLDRSSELIHIGDGGIVRHFSAFSPQTGRLAWSEPLQRLFWTENIPDPRWTMESESALMTIDNGKMCPLSDGRRYFNPAPSPVDGTVAVSQYGRDGRTALVVLDGLTGERMDSLRAPDGLQITESVWMGDGRIAVAAISDGGFGLYDATDGFRPLLEASPVKICQPEFRNGALLFISDRSGVNELYSLDSEGAVRQLSCTRYGISDYVFSGDSLYYSVLSRDSRSMFRTAVKDLPVRAVDFGERAVYPFAEELSRQEEAICAQSVPNCTFTEAKPYDKLRHAVHFHSWAPAFFNYDDLSGLDLESIYSSAGLGATGYFQNELGTLSGQVGYSASCSEGQWGHSGHLSATYRGLLPVLSLKLRYGTDTQSYQYGLLTCREESEVFRMLTGRIFDGKPSLDGTLQCYVPLDFSSGGWCRAVVPQVRLSFSDNVFNRSEVDAVAPQTLKDGPAFTSLSGYREGSIVPWTRLSANLRAYSVLGTAPSCILPRFGIGAEAGVAFRPALGDIFSPAAYLSVYGYLPGVVRTHGLQLTATGQVLDRNTTFGDAYIITAPRGFAGINATSFIESWFPLQLKLSAQYTMPLLSMDRSLPGGVAYLKNFELSGHMDYTVMGGGDAAAGSLFSAGYTLALKFANFLWLPYDTRLGICQSFNGGTSFDAMKGALGYAPRSYSSLVFSIDL